MQQSAWQLGGSHLIDSLNYTYYNNTNKLQNVIDGDNNPATTLGDFRTSSLSPYASGKTAAAIDYTYDGNGNLLTDLNKDIGSQTAPGIVYNHLDLPWQVSVRSATGTKGTITYIYDAAGTKLKKTTLDSAGNLQTVTTYIGPFQYQGTQSLSTGSSATPVDTLQFFGHEEGRVRVEADTTGGISVPSYKYDYFLKDHLGNTRLVLTDETQTDMYPAATMEVGDSATENLYYLNLDSTRSALPPGYPTDTTTNPNNYVAKVSSDGTVPAIGPGIVLKVMAGDQFSIRVSSWYRLNGTTPGTPVSPLTDLLTSLISGISGIPNPEGPGLSVLQANTPTLSSNVMQFLQDTGTLIVNTKPHAFVNWILLDNQFNYVAASSGFSQVGTDQQLQKTVLTNLPITSSGYLYIYTSNETPNVDVFFDNLQVTHTRGPLLEEDHYYPFGLTMAGISDKALKTNYAENKYRFNKGSELQNKEFSDGSGLEMYSTELRELDPQLGRWWQIDSKPDESQSPYSSMGNNPISRNDALGDEDEACCQELWDRVSNNFHQDVQRVKDFVSTALDNAKNNIEAGHTIPQQLVTQALDNPLSVVTGEGGPVGIVAEGLEATSVAKTGGNIVETEVPQVTKNAAQGKAWETQVTKDLASEGHDKIAEQVTVKPNDVKTGNVRLDNVSMKDGKIALTDAKSSATAPLTKNQKPGYPAIEKSGGVVVGDKGASQGYPAGTVIPPTKVDIRRPQQ